MIPTGIQVGLGVRPSTVHKFFSQGDYQAIRGIWEGEQALPGDPAHAAPQSPDGRLPAGQSPAQQEAVCPCVFPVP